MVININKNNNYDNNNNITIIIVLVIIIIIIIIIMKIIIIIIIIIITIIIIIIISGSCNFHTKVVFLTRERILPSEDSSSLEFNLSCMALLLVPMCWII